MTSSQHIRSAFDRDLEMITSKMLKMGGLVESSIIDAAEAFESRDLELAQNVRKRDKKIDSLEAEINEDITRIIALQAPAASDLRTLLSILKIAGNLERIGDYSKNMAKRTNVLSTLPVIEDSSSSLRRLVREVQNMLKDALDAYTQRDSELGIDIIARDREVDELYNSLFREFLTYMMEDPRSIPKIMDVLWSVRSLERIGDRCQNISEYVIYFVKGKDVRHTSEDDIEQNILT